jgi:multiple sugar transport system permease protein
MNRYRFRKIVNEIAFYGLVILILLPFLFVFYWMFLSSFKNQAQNMAMPPIWWVKPTLVNYQEVFLNNPFLTYLKNSVIVAVGATSLGLILGVPCAYGIARSRKESIAIAILTARIVPGISLLVPWFILFTRLKMIDTYLALILTHVVTTVPLIVWIMIGFFEDFPAELEDASLVDGCNVYTSFWHIALPVSRPGIAAAAILAFIASWNNFMFSLVISSVKTKTLPVAVFSFMTYTEINWGGLTAAATIITLPVLLLVLLIQKNIVRGLTLGAVKG